MSFGMQLEIQGDNTGLVTALRETKSEYNSLAAEAVRKTDTIAAAAQRATKSVTDLGSRAAAMSSGFRTAASEAARSSAAQAAQVEQSRSVMNDYAAALESAEGHVRDYSEAMEDSAEIQARSAARAVQAHEGMRSRVVSAFDNLKSKVKSNTAEIAASWKAAVDKIDPAKFEAAARRMGAASEELQRRTTRAWKAMAVAMTALATTAFFVGASFEQSMARVGSTVGATPAELAAMSAEAKKWGASTSFSAKQIAEAMQVAGDSIGDAATTIQAIGPIVQLAGARNIDLAESADLVTQALDAFNLKGTDAARVANVLAASAGKVDMNSVRAGLSSVAAAAGNVGLSIEQTVAMLAILDQGGQKATKSAAGLQGIFSALLNPSDELKKLMGGLTIEGDGLMAVMQRLASLGPAALAQAFDARQLQVIITLAKAGPKAFDDMTKSLTGTAAASEKFAQNQKNVQSQLMVLKNMVADIMVSAFEVFSGVALSSIEDVQSAVKRYKETIIGALVSVRDFVKEHKDQIAMGVKVAAVMVGIAFAVGTILVPLALLVKAWGTVSAAITITRTVAALIAPIFTTIAGAALRMVLAIGGLVGWPALIAVAAGALIAFGVHMFKTNETFRNVVRSILDAAKEFGQFLWNLMTFPVRKIVEFFDKSLSFIGKMFPGVEDAVRASMDAIKNVGGDVWEGIAGGAEAAFDWTKAKAIAGKDAVVGASQSMQKAWEGSFLNMGARADEFFSGLSEKGKRAMANMPKLADFAREANAPKPAAGGGGGSTSTGPKPQDIHVRVIPTLDHAAMITAANVASVLWEAGLRKQVESAKTHTAAWLAARETQIRLSYQQDVAGSDMTIAQIVARRLQMEDEIAAAHRENTAAAAAYELDIREAGFIRVAATAAAHTQESLNARLALIQMNYEREVAAADGSAAKIAEATANRDAQTAATRMQHDNDVLANWMANNEVVLLGLASVGAAYDTFFATILDKEMTGKRRREAMWESSKRAFVQGAAQMFKAYVVEQLKATIVAQGVQDAANKKSRFQEAKLGAVKAYQAFAGIPFVGPALGAAAAAAAFAFLIAFHSGGFVGRAMANSVRGNEVPAVLERGEYVVQRRAVDRIGVDTLNFMNSTGRIPDAGGTQPIVLQFNVNGGGTDVEALKEYVEGEVVSMLEDAMRDGRFRGTLRPSRSAA